MASSTSMKGFYKQSKKNAGISKPFTTKSKSQSKNSTSFGSNVAQPPALISHGSPDLQGELITLLFKLNIKKSLI